MQNCTTILGIIDMRQRGISYDDCRSRYKVGCSTITLIMMNILVARNRKSGNLEIGVPVLGNRLFCAWLLVHFYGYISQGLAVSAVRSSLY